MALAVRLDSPGPVLFRQERIGLAGSTFTMFKFRSMVVDAEARLAQLQRANEGAGLLFKMRDDPRITRVGAFIRRYSLDELPQLFNVLNGTMSLIGPRPPLPREVAAYEGRVNRRLLIKPGITGLWQVSGRSNLSWEESVKLDLYYVENWSVTTDFVILAKTVTRGAQEGRGVLAASSGSAWGSSASIVMPSPKSGTPTAAPGTPRPRPALPRGRSAARSSGRADATPAPRRARSASSTATATTSRM